MRRLVGVLALCALLTAWGAAPAVAARLFIDGNTLYTWCTGKKGKQKTPACTGYIVGVMDVLAADTIRGYRACLPNSLTLKHAKGVVIRWLRDNPEQRHYEASGLVAIALANVYPCR